MNIKRIQELVELMNSNDLAEIEVDEEGTKIHLIKRSHGPAEYAAGTSVPLQHAGPSNAQMAAAVIKQGEEAKKFLEVKSPMVGTFYRTPSPDAEPYVQVGDIVHKGDVLCIVEAMKLMNEVKSELDGKIAEILVESTAPVEFGQPMFLIEPV